MVMSVKRSEVGLVAIDVNVRAGFAFGDAEGFEM